MPRMPEYKDDDMIKHGMKELLREGFSTVNASSDLGDYNVNISFSNLDNAQEFHWLLVNLLYK